ncbi:MAG TPA: dienelactone hydrolase family protein [bacterium]|nr:dienelactone hydrolase family protein [bacterium]
MNTIGRTLAVLAAALTVASSSPPIGRAAAPPSQEHITFKSFSPSPAGPVPATVYRPDGPAPFRTIVLLHGCAGITNTERAWASWLLGAGYEIVMPDSLAPRNTQGLCAAGESSFRDHALDAFGALIALRSRSEISPARIAVIGWSHGGGAVLEAASAELVAEVKPPGGGFAAAVALYPHCASFRPGGIASPLLILAGGSDDEEPPAGCVARATQLRNAGAAIDLHVYPEATHVFDMPGPDRVVRQGNRTFHLRYDEAATQDARTRIAQFLTDRLR